MTVILSSISKRFGSRQILEDISLEIPSGSVTAFAGINGSGKTVLMRIVAGLVRPSSGRVVVDGCEVGRDADFPPSVGLLIESPAFLDSRTGFDNLRVLASIKGIAKAEQIAHSLERVGLDPADKRKYRTYSLGMKQRLGLAAAVMEQPALVILDEPSNALDSDAVGMLKRLIAEERERGAAILLSCHDSAMLHDVSDCIYHLENCRISSIEENAK